MSTFTTFRTDISTEMSNSGGSMLLRFVSMIEDALERRRSRLALMELTEDQLKDIGVSRCEAYREANRPFWS